MEKSIGITTLHRRSRARQPFVSPSQWCVAYEIFAALSRDILNGPRIVCWTQLIENIDHRRFHWKGKNRTCCNIRDSGAGAPYFGVIKFRRLDYRRMPRNKIALTRECENFTLPAKSIRRVCPVSERLFETNGTRRGKDRAPLHKVRSLFYGSRRLTLWPTSQGPWYMS